MSKSIAPGKEVFQFGIRHLPTGRWLKKTPGHSFYLTDIPSVYNSAKVAKKSVENESVYNPLCHDGKTEIVKFRLIMEEVKEPTEEELAYEAELKELNFRRKVLGEQRWEEIQSERGKWEIFRYINHLGNQPISVGDSLHCHDQVYKTSQGTYQLLWTHDQHKDEVPMSISRAIDYNWDEQVERLKEKYGIR
jgi:hypothetical protein